ncbi:MAG: hypothetical protein HDR06_13565 [Lachnospiraceae bacterium]|nr:hypothetical protein [Lachnospiraceae bacterium]
MKVSIHDSCGYRHKPQVHKAIRNLLTRMNIKIEETQFSGMESVCCGDNFYGIVSNEQVEDRIRMRANQRCSRETLFICFHWPFTYRCNASHVQSTGKIICISF